MNRRDIKPYHCEPGDNPRNDAARLLLEHHQADIEELHRYEKWALIEAIGIMFGAVFVGLVAAMILRSF